MADIVHPIGDNDSLDCQLYSNLGSVYELQRLPLEDDPEEESELYESEILPHLKASVLYLPYQDGIYLHFTVKGERTGTQSVTAVARDQVELTINFAKILYTLDCRKRN